MRQDWVPIFWEPYFQGSCLIFYFNSLRLTFRTTSIKYRKQYVECVRYRLSLKLMHISLSGIFALAHFISGCLSLQLRKYPWSLSAKRNSKILGFKTDSHLPLCSRKDRARTQRWPRSTPKAHKIFCFQRHSKWHLPYVGMHSCFVKKTK